jgi:hypothetical protein
MPIALPARAALAAALVAALAAAPAAHAAPAGLADARRRAAALTLRVTELAAAAERLARAVDGQRGTLDGLIQARGAHERALAVSEARLAEARAALVDDVRTLYMRGPLAPLDGLLAARDPIDLELARRVAAGILGRDASRVAAVEVAGRALQRERGELDASQAAALEAGRSLARQRAAIAERLAAEQALPAGARADVRRLVEQALTEREAAARAALGAGGGARHPGGRVCDLAAATPAERWIIEHESGGDPQGSNPASTAFGLGQLLLQQRLRYLGADFDTTDCAAQLGAFRAYVRDRYRTPDAALAFWLAHRWY